MPSPTQITCSQLHRLIGTPDLPTLIDIRIDDDFGLDERLIPTSYRVSHKSIHEIALQLDPKQKVVVICHEGQKLSQGCVGFLRDKNILAESLEGGFVAWAKANYPLVPEAKIPKNHIDGRTVWVTRHRPKIDRIACPWLIRRFVDPKALFLFVSPLEVLGVAEKFNATPFDVEDVFWSHREEACTFDTMIEEFDLQTGPLKDLAKIIRGADTNRLDIMPESAGLLAASLGLSRMYKDDLKQLDAGMLLYDAFYRWARDAKDEGHDWPTNVKTG